jgi:hypothetical protein
MSRAPQTGLQPSVLMVIGCAGDPDSLKCACDSPGSVTNAPPACQSIQAGLTTLRAHPAAHPAACNSRGFGVENHVERNRLVAVWALLLIPRLQSAHRPQRVGDGQPRRH